MTSPLEHLPALIAKLEAERDAAYRDLDALHEQWKAVAPEFDALRRIEAEDLFATREPNCSNATRWHIANGDEASTVSCGEGPTLSEALAAFDRAKEGT